MARPRTTGPNIQFRLPAELHDEAARRAGKQGVTVHAWARDIVLGALPSPASLDAMKRPDRCIHAEAIKAIGSTGAVFYTCGDCGARRIGITGAWKQP